MLPLFEKFIQDSRTGRRLQPNGARISEGTLKNYGDTLRLLRLFSEKKEFSLRLYDERRLSARQTEREATYWKRFYRRFTEFLYREQGYFDNYIGSVIKNVRTFFNYLNKHTSVRPGPVYRLFYVRKEEVPIFPLLPEELNYLISGEDLGAKLTPRLSEARDVFVFGCTVALRVSDLLSLKPTALRQVGDQTYLAVRSKKTATDTLVKLPAYCLQILERHRRLRRSGRLLPKFNASNLNGYIKQLLEIAGFTQEVTVERDRQGKKVKLKKEGVKGGSFRFCDVASTHTMRRTAISTMLCLGMPETVVRRISGHAPGSKEFYRYVLLAQTYLDSESDKVFARLQEKALKVA